MDVKIGKSTKIENTLSQYSRGNRNIKLLDMWRPNPEKNLSTTERGVHEIAENYSYDRQSEKFVFLQSRYQEFADTVNKILRNTSKQELGETDETPTLTPEDDYTGCHQDTRRHIRHKQLDRGPPNSDIPDTPRRRRPRKNNCNQGKKTRLLREERRRIRPCCPKRNTGNRPIRRNQLLR